MRALLAWLLTVALLAGSTVGAAAQASEASDEQDAHIEHPVPPWPPGYYPYGGDSEGPFRYYDGEAWIGPEVGPEVADAGNALVGFYGIDAETLILLSFVFDEPGGAEALELILTFLLAIQKAALAEAVDTATRATLEGQPPTQEEPPSSVEGQPPTQEEPPSSVEGQPPTQEEPPSSVEDPPNWGMLISLGPETSVSFNGRVTGNAGGWRYEGSSFKSSPGWWHECHGPAPVSCTFKGDPEDLERPNVEMRCTVTWKRVKRDMPKTWETLTDAQFEQFWHNTGEFKGWVYKGWTREYEEDQKTFKLDYPAVTLRGADRKDVVDLRDCE